MSELLKEVLEDWNADEGRDFVTWSHATRTVLQRILGHGPEFLSALVDEAARTPALRVRFETHQLLDYLVLYDCAERGLRLRLHISTSDHLQRVHDHRFSFSSAILTGRYEHSYFGVLRDPYSQAPSDHAIRYQDRMHPDPLFAGVDTRDMFALRLIRTERGGDTYTMHHSACHTVLTTKHTVSLVLRGSARKERSFIYDRDTKQLWWRFGRENEAESRVSTKIMSDAHLLQLRQTLNQLGVI